MSYKYTSMPSRSVTVANIYETEFIVEECKFNYNYFTVDETVAGSATTFRQNGVDQTYAVLHPGMVDEDRLFAEAQYSPPRSIELNWHPVVLPTSLKAGGVPIPISITEFGLENLLYAESLSNDFYYGVSLQDQNPSETFYGVINDTLPILGSLQNFNNSLIATVNSIETAEPGRYEVASPSSVDDALTVIGVTDGTGGFVYETVAGPDTRIALNKVLSNYQSLDYGFEDPETGDIYVPGGISPSVVGAALDPVKYIKFSNSVFSTLVYDYFYSSAASQSGAFNDEYLLYPKTDPYINRFLDAQTAARSRAAGEAHASPAEFLASDYDVFLSPNYIAFAAEVDPDEAHPSLMSYTSFYAYGSARIAGYLIEKYEVSQDGTVRKMPTLIIEIPHAFGSVRSDETTFAEGSGTDFLTGEDFNLAEVTRVVDASVAYGKVYQYKIKSVMYIESPGIVQSDDGTTETYRLGFFVVSRGSPMITVNCYEQVTPKPPTDIEFHYDYVNHNLIMDWNFPVNPQRDIKKFQVWRRRHGKVSENNVERLFSQTYGDIDATHIAEAHVYLPEYMQNYPSSANGYDQPFSLIRVFDFNDAISPLTTSEDFSIPNDIITKTPGAPRTRYIDREFNKDSRNIYTLSSVDARGLCSNYAEQFEVSFDIYKNKLIVEYVSKSGAPKPYPNLYLRRGFAPILTSDTSAIATRQEFTKSEVMLDTIKTSGFKHVRICLDPDYYTYRESEDDGTSDPHLLFSTDEDPKPVYKMTIINIDNAKSKTIDITVKDERSSVVETSPAAPGAVDVIESVFSSLP